MRGPRPSGFDNGLLLAVLALIVIGLLSVYSASFAVNGARKVLHQCIWMGAGLLCLGVASWVDYRSWTRWFRLLLLLTGIVLLVTLVFARPVNGARSWIDLGIFRLQPSEFAKAAVIVALAGLLARFGPRIRHPRFLLHSLLAVAIPILLVLAQPDLGTAMVLCVIWVAMVAIAGARWWGIAAVCLGALLLFVFAWMVPMPGGKTLIKDYQKKRLDFLHADPAEGGYNQRQARIAIGAGGFWGRGYLHGTQANRQFLPEQDTDFIFAVIGEEFGLLGCLLVLGLYLFVLFRMLRIIEEAESPFGQFLVTGTATMIAVHVMVNVGMCLSLSPVTGIPLPLISYGGSNALVNLLMIGAVLNVSRHRQPRRTWAVSEELIRL